MASAAGEVWPQENTRHAFPTFVVDRPGQWLISLTPDAGLTAQDQGGAGNYDLTVEARAPQAAGVSLQLTLGSAQGSC
jgi:hypothetical protein